MFLGQNLFRQTQILYQMTMSTDSTDSQLENLEESSYCELERGLATCKSSTTS